MQNYVRQFFQIRVVFHTLIFAMKSVTLIFLCFSDTSNSLSDCIKNLKKICQLENFCVKVLNTGIHVVF